MWVLVVKESPYWSVCETGLSGPLRSMSLLQVWREWPESVSPGLFCPVWLSAQTVFLPFWSLCSSILLRKPTCSPQPTKDQFPLDTDSVRKCVSHSRVDGRVLTAPEAPPTIKLRCRWSETERCVYSLAILEERIQQRSLMFTFTAFNLPLTLCLHPPNNCWPCLLALHSKPLNVSHMSGHLETLVLTAVAAGFLSWGGFQTFLVPHSFGLTVILNNQLELVAAASHLLEGLLLAAASCLCWCSWTGLPCGQAEIQRNPLCKNSPGMDRTGGVIGL